MSNVVYFQFRKPKPQVSCSFCGNSYEVGVRPVFSTRDNAHTICEICIRLLNAQLRALERKQDD